MIHIRTFRAPDDPEACSKFIVGHKRLLELYGITQITSNKQDWVEDPKTMVILVEDKETKSSMEVQGSKLKLISMNCLLLLQLVNTTRKYTT